jgi:hypothetical protein
MGNKAAALILGVFSLGALKEMVRAISTFGSKAPDYSAAVGMFLLMLLLGYGATWAWSKKPS